MGGREHSFSIEIKSKDNIKTFSISNDAHSGVFLEGYLGGIEKLDIVEGMMLEIKGTKGTLRIDLDEREITQILASIKGRID